MVVHRTTAVIIFGSPTKFLVVLGLPEYHYFYPGLLWYIEYQTCATAGHVSGQWSHCGVFMDMDKIFIVYSTPPVLHMCPFNATGPTLNLSTYTTLHFEHYIFSSMPQTLHLCIYPPLHSQLYIHFQLHSSNSSIFVSVTISFPYLTILYLKSCLSLFYFTSS